MKRDKQFELFKLKRESTHGGILHGESRKTNPKCARPITTKNVMHVVMRSSKAKGSLSLLKKNNRKIVDGVMNRQSKIHGIKIYRLENVGNHLHLTLRPSNRRGLQSFFRASTGLIARKVLEKERGPAAVKAIKAELIANKTTPAKPVKTGIQEGPFKSSNLVANDRFWDYRPFTRVIAWGPDFAHTNRYLDKNKLEALGFDRGRVDELLKTES